MSIRNLDRMFRPASVAFIGASSQEASVGGQITLNILNQGFGGPVYLVNPKGGQIFGNKAYKSVSALPEAPDLAVIATPPKVIPGLIAELGEKGTRAAVIVTAGFGEGGDEKGKALAQQVLDAARPHTLRVVGPNCVGLTVPPVGLHASFAPTMPLTGKLAFASQSGAVITAVLDWATERGIGFSRLVSMGNMLDVDFGDVLDFLARDQDTQSVLLYVESVTDARKFMSAARALARSKPVIVMKAGRHKEGAQAAASHTGAMAGADAVYDAAFRRAGLVRVFTMEEMFDAVETLALAKRPRRNRLAIVSNGGGFGVLATDSLIDLGGQMAELEPKTIEALDKVLPPTWSKGNPVDIIGDAPGQRYADAMAALAGDKEVGALLVLNAPTALADATEAARAVAQSDAAAKLPILTSWLGGARAEPARELFTKAGIPTYDTPSRAVRAFMHLVAYRRAQEALLETPPSVPHEEAPDTETARGIVEAVLAEGRTLLTEVEAKRVLAAYGIPVGRTEVAADADAAVERAEAIGYPVALKILSREITHKSDVGGVALNLENADAVRRAAEAMLAKVAEKAPDAAIDGFTVQEMVRRPHAHELILGTAEDPQFGPILLFGHGGTAAETIDDKAIALPPLNMSLAFEAMKRTRIYRLLKGYRDRPQAALTEIAGALVRLSRLVADCAEITELDINPLLADDKGVLALDARIVLRPPEEGRARASTRRFAIRPYPSNLEERVSYPGGRHLLIRPIRPEDEPRLQETFEHLSPSDVRLRFFVPMKVLNHDMAARLSQIDYHREMALVLAEDKRPGDAEIMGVVRIYCDPDFESAEFAVTVRSDEAGRGMGPLLMRKIIDYGKSIGLKEIYGLVLKENRGMLRLGEHLGFLREPMPDEPELVKLRLDLTA